MRFGGLLPARRQLRHARHHVAVETGTVDDALREYERGLAFVALALVALGIGVLVVWIPMGILTLWFIYRIARGWMALRDRRPMYA